MAASSNEILLRGVDAITADFKKTKSAFNQGELGEKFKLILSDDRQFRFSRIHDHVVPLFRQFPNALANHNHTIRQALKVTGKGDHAVLYVDIDNVLLSNYGNAHEEQKTAINYPLLETLRLLKQQFPNLKVKILSSMSIQSLMPSKRERPISNAAEVNPRAFLVQTKDNHGEPLFDSVITTDDLAYAKHCKEKGLALEPGQYFNSKLRPLINLLYDESGKLRSTITISEAVLAKLAQFKKEVEEYENKNRSLVDYSWYPRVFGQDGLIAEIAKGQDAKPVELNTKIVALFNFFLEKSACIDSVARDSTERASKHFEKARLMDWDLHCHGDIQAIAVIDDTAAVTTEAMTVAAIHKKAVVGFTPKRLDQSLDKSEEDSIDKFLGIEMQSFAPLMQMFLTSYDIDKKAYLSQLAYLDLVYQRTETKEYSSDWNKLAKELYHLLGMLYADPGNNKPVFVVDQQTMTTYITDTVLKEYNAAAEARARFFFGGRTQTLLEKQTDIMKAAEHYSPKALLLVAKMLIKAQFIIKDPKTRKAEKIQQPDLEAAFWLLILAGALINKQFLNVHQSSEGSKPLTALFGEVLSLLSTLSSAKVGSATTPVVRLNARSPKEIAMQQLSLLPDAIIQLTTRLEEQNNELQQFDTKEDNKMKTLLQKEVEKHLDALSSTSTASRKK